MNSEDQETGRAQPTAAHVAALCNRALGKLPDDKRIQDHWHPQWSSYVKSLKSLIVGASRAETDRWDDDRIKNFVTTFNALSMGLATGYGLGVRDGNGQVFWPVHQDTDPELDPFGCGNAPNYPPGASCALRCHFERNWCLCREGCDVTLDCGSWPCLDCFECNVTHAICAADCIFIEPPPPPPFVNPRVFNAFSYDVAPE
jgi:hypothetical protein